MEDCIFCKIAKGEIPSSKLYEDKDFLAFLDISPSNYGHALVIPKAHFELFTDIPDKTLQGFSLVTKKVAKAIVQATDCEGFNIIINNKHCSGQLVPHVHFHILPRYEKDDFKLAWSHKKYPEGEMEKYKKRIIEKIK